MSDVITRERIRQMLAAHPFTKGLSETEIESLADLADLREFEAGAKIFEAGAAADTFYLVRSGLVALEVENGSRGAAYDSADRRGHGPGVVVVAAAVRVAVRRGCTLSGANDLLRGFGTARPFRAEPDLRVSRAGQGRRGDGGPTSRHPPTTPQRRRLNPTPGTPNLDAPLRHRFEDEDVDRAIGPCPIR